jgi:hypothetical protein
MKFEEKYNYKGWPNCIRLSNNKTELIITTDVGPRIIRFGSPGGQNIFGEIENQLGKTGGVEYRLYGGTRFWHGPEANPRTYIPDNNMVKYSWDSKELTLIQETETRTGIQKEINVMLSNRENSVKVNYRVYNRTLWDIKLAPWVLSIMNRGGRAILPQEPFQNWEERLTPVRPMVLWGYTTMDDPRWIWGRKYIQLSQDPESTTRQKLGILNTLGWAAYYLNSQVFIKRYEYSPEVGYTDFGVNTEIYTDAEIIEVETLGAFATIEPDKYIEHKENWYLFDLILDKEEKSIDKKLAGLIDKTKMPTINHL